MAVQNGLREKKKGYHSWSGLSILTTMISLVFIISVFYRFGVLRDGYGRHLWFVSTFLS
jgi:hypothetical protein